MTKKEIRDLMSKKRNEQGDKDKLKRDQNIPSQIT